MIEPVQSGIICFSTFLWKYRGLAILLIFLCVQLTTTAQIAETKQKKYRELQISSLIGFSAGGPKNDIEDNLISSGFGDDAGPGWFGGNGVYPDITKSPVIDLEATLFFRLKHGISANTALADNVLVAGHSNVGSGSYLRFDSKLTSYSLNYVFRTGNNELNFFIGPSYMVHHIESDKYASEYFETINHKIGLYLGCAIHVLQKPHFFLAFKANMRLTSKSEIGPYAIEQQSGIFTGNPTIYTLGYNQTEVNLNTFNAGIVVGIRFLN